jgi:hypothetical protein
MTKLGAHIGLFIAFVAPSLPANGQTLNVLYSFAHDKLGYSPFSGVTVGPRGEIYGTLPLGGASGFGAAYQLLPPASPGGPWVEQVLHSFSSQNGDGQVLAGLLLGPSGQLYGVTSYNNTPNGDGTAFELKPPSGTRTHWSEAVLHAFTGTNGDGAGPQASLVFGPHKSLYGTTYSGGAAPGDTANGTVFHLTPPSAAGGTWTETVLFSFGLYLGDAVNPVGALAIGSKEELYGATGGGLGAVFELAPPAAPGGNWSEIILHSFTGAPDGNAPNAGVTIGQNGALYGTT